MVLGFTSGRISNLKYYLRVGCTAIELNVGTIEGLEKLNTLFDYVSIHAPTGPFDYLQLDALVKIVKPKVVVLHPDNIINPRLVNELGWPLALENMDWRKSTGKTVEQLEKWFDIFPQAKMVLDLNHVFTNTADMSLASSLWQKFSDRVAHFHLSGFSGENKPHDFLFKTGQDKIIAALPVKYLPIILEPDISDLSPENIQREYQYVTDKINLL